MKTRLLTRACLLVSLAAFNLTFSPAAFAQTPANPPTNSAVPDSSQASKSTDSTAEQAQAGGAPMNSGSQQRMDSKGDASGTNSLDTNPGNAPTGSGEESATKMPAGTTDESKNTGGSEMSSSGKPSAADKMFMMKAAQGGMLEVQAGKVAQDKGTSDKVKEIGARMVKDHSMINDKLMAIAKDQDVTLPDSLDAKHQAMVDHMSGMSGSSFDKNYIAQMVKAHQKDAMAFQKEIDSTDDSALKKFATHTLKIIKMHLSMIKQAQSSM